MIDFQYLYKGICGLANAHQAGTMAGHLGAATVTGYFFGEDLSELPDEVFRGIEGELERVITGQEAIWFNARKVGLTPAQLFEPYPHEEPQPEKIPLIANALKKNIGTLKQSGHNVIFAAAAIRAISDHQEYATPKIVAGIQKLIAAFDKVAQGRGYYGKASGWKSGAQVKLTTETSVPMYQSIQQMIDATVGELIASAAIKKQGFGGLWHIVNHAAALTELDRFGYKEIAELGLPTHHHHLLLWQSLPDVENELGPVTTAISDPRTPSYWKGILKRDDARLTHRIKTLYGYHTIRRFIQDLTTRKLADHAFLYLMA